MTRICAVFILVSALHGGVAGAEAPGTSPKPNAEPKPAIAIAEPNRLRIPRVSHAPKLEDVIAGRTGEAGAEVADFRQREPGDGIPASRPTYAYVSYDDKNLYIIFDCREEPGRVRARMSKREDIGDDDRVMVYLDTFRDRLRAYVFSTNALGIQRDGIQNAGSSKPDYTFDTVWHSEAKLTENGFAVLMAIPFRSLRFTSSALQTWGIALGRHIPTNTEDSFWPYITTRVEGFVPQMAALEGLEDVSPGRNVQFIPYGALASSRFLDTSSPAYRTSHDPRGGLDSKIVIKKAFTLDVTANPDFSQVESDEPQVTVNKRFEVFFPEKRPFFLENAGFFHTPENLFFSRRIVDPEFGARLTGKLGRWAIGALAADDRAQGKRYDPTSAYFDRRAIASVARVQRELGKDSSVGLLATNWHFASSSNRVFALDTRLKLSPNWVFTGQAIRSSDKSLSGDHSASSAYTAEITRSGRHFTYSGDYFERSPNFNTPLGFIKRVDIRQTDQYAGYLWRPENSSLLAFGPSVTYYTDWDHGGRLQDWFVSPGIDFYFRGPWQLSLSRSEFYEYFLGRGFREHSTHISFYTARWKRLVISGSFSKGTGVNYSPPEGVAPFLAGKLNGSVSLTYRPSSRWRIDQTYFYARLSAGVERGILSAFGSGSVFNNHITRTKINYQFTRSLSLRTILDYNAVLPNSSLIRQSLRKQVTADVLLTYLLNPFTALYVGYTDRYQNLALDPAAPPKLRVVQSPFTSVGRQFFIKMSYQFRF